MIGNNKKRKKLKRILIPVLSLVLLLGIFIVAYLIDNSRFFSHLKKYNDEYLMKMTYLVVDKDKVPENINLDATFPGYTDEILYTNTELVTLEKDGDYLYLDLNGQINKSIIQNEVDYVFALNDFDGNVLKDCEYDKEKNIAKIPISYYENKTQNIPIQLEIESALTEKDLANVEIKTRVKSIFTNEKIVKQDNTNFYIEFKIDNFTINVNDKRDLEIYVNGYDTKLQDDYYAYDEDKKLVRIGIPALLVDEIDIKVNNSLFSKAYAVDANGITVTTGSSGFSDVTFEGMNTINLLSRPGYAQGDTYTVTLNSNEFEYCGVNDVSCYSFTTNMGPGNFQVSNNVFDYDYTYFQSNGNYYGAYKYSTSGGTTTATFNDGVYAYPFRIDLKKLSGTYLDFNGARKIPSTLVHQRLSSGETVNFDQTDLKLPFFCLHAGSGGSHDNITVTVKVIKKTTDYMILSLVSNNKYYGQSANAYIKVTWNKYIQVEKSYNGPDDGVTRRFSIYKSLDGSTCSGVSTAVSTSTKWGDGKYYLGWTGTEQEWNNYSYGYPSLTPGVYCIWESSYNGTGFGATKNYNTKYTYNGNDVTRTDDGYTFAKITINGNETRDNSSVNKLILNAENTMKGYIELTKQYVGTNDGQTRYFGLYKSHNGECENITNRDLVSKKDGTGTTFYLGWDSTNHTGLLEYGETYCIWEAKDSTYTRAPDTYSVTYDNTQYDDDWVYGKVTLDGNNLYTENGVKYIYKTATATNTAEEKSKIRVKKLVEGEDNSSSNPYYQAYHFNYYVYPDGCSRGSTSSGCSTVELCTKNNGVTDYYGVDSLGNPTLPRNSTYVVEEETDGNGNAVVYDSDTCTTHASGTSVPVLQPNHIVKTRTLSVEANTVGYGNSDNNPSPIQLKIQKQVTNDSSFDFNTYHFRFIVYLNSPNCTATSYGGTGVDYSVFYTNSSGEIDVTTIGDVELTEDNLNDSLCIVETVRNASIGNAKIYDSNKRVISTTALPFYSVAVNRPISTTIGALTNSGNTYYVDAINRIEKGYLEVQKIVPEISDFDFDANRFAFNVYDESDTQIDTIYTDEYGYATYGITNSENQLDYNSIYYLREVVDPVTNDAVIYNPDHSVNQNTNLKLRPSYSSSGNKVSVKISKVGSGTNGKNSAGTITNTPVYGYLTIIKSFDDTTGLNFRTDHIGFNIYDSNNQLVDTVYTNSSRRATYGLDSTTGSPTLNVGDTYYIEEIVNGNYAVIFDDNHQPKNSDVRVRPTYLATGNNVSVTIAEGNNIEYISNKTDYGYIEVRKSITTSDNNFFSTYHFKYNIYDSLDNLVETIITDNNGIANYGLDSLGHPYLYYNEVYYVREEMNGNYAKLYDSNGNEITSSSSNYKYIQPQYPQGTDHETVTIQNIGANTVNVSTVSNAFEQRGYVGVQKLVQGNAFVSNDYYFKYTVIGPDVPSNTTTCTNNVGLATYGASNGDGILPSGNTYTFTEDIDSTTGFAKVYGDSNCSTLATGNSVPIVEPVNSSVNVTVSSVGAGTAELTTENYSNNYLGYVGVQKKVNGSAYGSSTEHFKYTVTGPDVPANTTVCTNDSGFASYGDENGFGTLALNNEYVFTEEVDSTTGIAKVYGDSNCSTLATGSVPSMKPTNASVTVKVNRVGLQTAGLTTEDYDNEYLGYVGIQKTISGVQIDTINNHFKYTVTGPGVPANTTVCTNDSGFASYGDVNGYGTLNLNDEYVFTEEVDSTTGIAIVYDNTCNQEYNASTKAIVKPVNASVTVKVESVGLQTAGLTTENYPNKYLGYVGVQKEVQGGTVELSDYHFKYTVTGPGVPVDTTVCTNNSGKAVYGASNGNGTLDLNNVYVFTEATTASGNAILYSDIDCNNSVEGAGVPVVRPVNASVSVKVESVGQGPTGANIESYPNGMEFGYIEIQKKVEGSIPNNFFDTNHFKFDVYDDSNALIDTVMTDNAGKIIYGYDSTNSKGTLAKNSHYTFKEKTSGGFAIIYDSTGAESSNNIKLKPVYSSTSDGVTVEISNVGSGASGKNTGEVDNIYKGYVGIQKKVDGTAYVSNDYHFKYTVTGPNVPANTIVCTNNSGKATYGDINGQGTLDLNNTYTFTEDVDSTTGIAKVYSDTSCNTQITTTGIPSVKPVSSSVTVTVSSTGEGNSGYTESDYDNNQLGYVGVHKVYTGTQKSYSDYHFKFLVNGQGATDVPVCTDDSGYAYYGKDSTTGNGTLNRGLSYTFTEVTDNTGFAEVYSDANCTTPADANKPRVLPVSRTVPVTVLNIGTGIAGFNSQDYTNKYENCLTIRKTYGSSSVLEGAEFELYNNNTCTGSVVATITTRSSGLANVIGLSGTEYYAKEVTAPPGYGIITNNCVKVTANEQTTSDISTCTVTDIENAQLYIAFYKTKEDGTPLTEATFKVKDSSNNYITVSGKDEHNCWIYSGTDNTGTELTVNNASTGQYCVSKLPAGTYTAIEQATGNNSYWIDNGTISGLEAKTTIEAKKGDGSNTVMNKPYVITFYKVREDLETPIENTRFKIKESGTSNYIKTSGKSSVSGYTDCYVYTGTGTESEASQLQTDSSGKICVIRTKKDLTYEAIETESGDAAYYIGSSTSISVTSKTAIDTKSNSNTLKNKPYKMSFYKAKEDGTPLTGARFKVAKGSSYIKATGTDTDGCYIYSDLGTENEGSEMITDSNGRICLTRVPKTNGYKALEKSTGDTAYYIFDNGTIDLVVDKEIKGKEASNTVINKPYLINFYKVVDNGTPVGGAEFVITDSNGRYVEVDGTSDVSGYNGCYIYSGLSDRKTSNTTIVTSTENKENGVSVGEACVIKLPQGTYKVTETKPVEYHTFGTVTNKNFETTKNRVSMNNDNKFINEKTEFKFTKSVAEEAGYDAIWTQMTTEELMNIPFTIYDVNGNPVSVIQTSSGIYEYAGNSIDGTSGDSTTSIYLNNNREFYVYHLPKGTYTVKESECCCEDTCDSPSNSTCYGYYSPSYSNMNASSYTFTIDDCSTSKTVGKDETGANICSTSIATQTLDNNPTEVDFTKTDFYSYVNPEDTVKFENEEEINIFDGITFKVYYIENGQKVYLDFAKVGNTGTCSNENNYSEYRFIPSDTSSSIKDQLTITQELHTCGGHIKITHLCRGRVYYIEEVSVPDNAIFTLPETEEARTRELDLECCKDSETKPTTTTIIKDKPSKVSFEKRDSKYGYLIPDETTTFELYRCESNVSCHPSDYSTVEERANAGISIVKFNPRGTITNDEEDPGLEVYRMVTNDTTVSNYVTDLHPYYGKLVLRYLQGGYQYVLLETVSPDGYTLPRGRRAETSFTIDLSTVEVEEIDVVNKPTSLLIRKYADDGSLLAGAQFKIYEGTTCEAGVAPKDQPKELLKLKTIRDGVYENREVKDTQVITTCKDRQDSKCSDITSTLTLDKYVDTWTNFDNSVNQNNDRVEIQEGEILIQYLDYGHCYIIEEVKAPQGYSLPENEDERFAMITITKDDDVVDTLKQLVNKPTPFTFYKYDDYNNLIDGGEFKLQRLNNNKKYEDVTVTEEVSEDKLFYKVDPNSTNKTIRTINGSATIYYLEEGQYRVVETKAPEGMELPNKEINVTVFYVDSDGSVVGSPIITNKPKTEKITIKPKATAELIVQISTGMERVRYGLIIGVIVVAIFGLIIIQRKRKKD